MDKTIMISGEPIFYRVIGQGKPVVLLHGFAEDGNIWENQSAFLQGHFQLIIPDLPGSGGSSLTGEVSMQSMADVVHAILVKEEISETVMIGHSMGGYVTLAFAEKYPQLLKGLGLFHSTAYADNDEKKSARKKNMTFIRSHGTLAFLKQSVPTLFSDDFNQQHPGVVGHVISMYEDMNPAALEKYQEAMMLREDKTEVLKHFVKPVLFIIGKHDKAIPFEDSLRLCHLPPLSYIHILENAGHMGMYEEVEKSNGMLHTFLEDLYSGCYLIN